MNHICHDAVVSDTQQGKVTVQIQQTEACAQCRAARQCNASGAKMKTMTINTDEADNYTKGQRVVVSTPAANGPRAVMLAFILPFIVMIAAVVVAYIAGAGEPAMALAAIAAIAVYYALLATQRRNIARNIQFEIKPA